MALSEVEIVERMKSATRNATMLGYIVFFLIFAYFGLGGDEHPDAAKLITAALAGMVAGLVVSFIAQRLLLAVYGVPAQYRGNLAIWQKGEPQRPVTISIARMFDSEAADVLASRPFPPPLDVKTAIVHRGGVVKSPTDTRDISRNWGVMFLTRTGLAFFPDPKDDDVEFLKGLGWTALQTMQLAHGAAAGNLADKIGDVLKDGIEALGVDVDVTLWLKASMSHRDHIVLPWVFLVQAMTAPAQKCVIIKAEVPGAGPQYFKLGDAGSSLPTALMTCRFYRELELATKLTPETVQQVCSRYDNVRELVQAHPTLFGPVRTAASLTRLQHVLTA